MGRGGFRLAVRAWSRGFSLRTWKKDLPAGLVLGVESVPDGLAGGLLAGVNPVFGLYGYVFGTIFGALATSSAFMTVQATGAMSVVVSDVPQVHGSDAAAERALFTLAILTGLIMLGLGLARLGWIVRWVPNAVLTGFVNAVAVNIVLGQLDNLTGYHSAGANRVLRALDSLVHLPSWSWPDVAVGLLTMAIIVISERTRIGALGMVLAIVVSSGFAAIGGDTVRQLRDITTVPAGLPTPVLPDLAAVPVLIVPAVALAFVGLVQGAAISRSVANPDGQYADPSGDFRGQGIANIATGLLQGMPVGGSMSATAIITNAGARSRVAQLTAGATMILVILTLSSIVGYVAMPALAGLLIVVGVQTLKPHQLLMVWRTGAVQASVMAATFVLTLLIPLQYAVLVGIAISIILHVARQANRVSVRRWSIDDDGAIVETDPPAVLGSEEIVMLRPYGSLFFASAGTFEDALPRIDATSHGSVVIITLRGKEDLGSTFITVITRYASRLDESGCVLKISGVSEAVRRQLTATGAAKVLGSSNLYPMTATLTESTLSARRDAEHWVTGSTASTVTDVTAGSTDGIPNWLRDTLRWGRQHLTRRGQD